MRSNADHASGTGIPLAPFPRASLTNRAADVCLARSKLVREAMTTATRYPAPSSAPTHLPWSRPSALTVGYWLLGVLALALVALMTVRAIPAYDLYWQLKTGEVIWQSGGVPKTDLFSYTAAGERWYVQEWLCELLFYGLWQNLGRESLVALRMGVITAAFGLVLWRAVRRSERPLLSVGMTLL